MNTNNRRGQTPFHRHKGRAAGPKCVMILSLALTVTRWRDRPTLLLGSSADAALMFLGLVLTKSSGEATNCVVQRRRSCSQARITASELIFVSVDARQLGFNSSSARVVRAARLELATSWWRTE